MLSIKNCISCVILLNVFIQIKSLVELPIVEDNNIAIAEAAIRNTVNKIFTIFKIPDVKHKPRLKQYSTIHNFFVSITLTDCNSLKEITRLTRVNNIDKNTENFITHINEVLNEDDKSYEAFDTNNIYVTKHIAAFIRKLKYLKEKYMSARNTAINANVLKYFEDDGEEALHNVTEITNIDGINGTGDKTLRDNDFWQRSGRRIFQGIRTTIKQFPFMASILFFKKFQCAGSILKDDLVITSASCLQLAWNNRFFRENPSFLSVQVGSDAYEGGGDNIAVIEIYFFPRYDPKTLRHNLALMRLHRKINFRSHHTRVKKIDFDRNPSPMPINSPKITVIGWGARDSTNIIGNVLHNKLSYAELDYYPLSDCQEHYSPDFVTERHFCAGFMSKGSGACNRDAGGPGVIDNILLGVISFGSPICGAVDAPTVFTKLGYYTDWIEGVMEQEIPSHYRKTTTLAPTTYSSDVLNREPVEKIKTHPLTTPTVERLEEMDHLRIAQDEGFKNFLANMFSNDDIKEYFDKSSGNADDETTDDLGSDENYKQSSAAKLIKTKLKQTNMPSTSFVTLSDSSDENESVDKQNITTTESERKVTVLENVSNDDKTLEDDIMSLIDNLDLDKILKPNDIDNSNHQKKPANTKEKDNNKKVSVKTTASTPKEKNLSIESKQQSVLNLIFLSEENKDTNDNKNVGMSKEANKFKDLTFRDRPNVTEKPNTLSETALYELISKAIDEEAKRLRKQKRYII